MEIEFRKPGESLFNLIEKDLEKNTEKVIATMGYDNVVRLKDFWNNAKSVDHSKIYFYFKRFEKNEK